MMPAGHLDHLPRKAARAPGCPEFTGLAFQLRQLVRAIGDDELGRPRRQVQQRVIPPELMTHAVTQPNPFRPEFLCKARPRTQFDEPWISNLKAAEQTPVRA